MSGKNAATVRTLWISQNFLTSSKIIDRILSRTNLSTNDHVIEIGPGKGHITAALLERCAQVTAIELDAALCAKLKTKFCDAGNLRLCHDDFLKWKLPKTGSYKVFSNVPFSITTDIIKKLTTYTNSPDEIWLVVEKGAAKRFMGKPKETLRSLMLKPRYDAEIVYHFKREDFHPMPSVNSVLLHLKKKARPDIPRSQFKEYEQFITEGFRRGAGGLRQFMTKGQLKAALKRASIAGDITPGSIRYVQWLCLFRGWRG